MIKAKSPIAWVGGKFALAHKIIPLIPQHHCYVEPFAGAAWVLFRKEPSAVEILNDVNSELTTMYKCIKNHLEEFMRCLKWLLVSRDQFDEFMNSPPEILTDIQRSIRFYYLQRTGYGAKAVNQTFGIGTTRPSNLNILNVQEDLSAAWQRLVRVYIENRPYSNIFERFDKPDTFFYVDPPYFGCEDYYGENLFSQQDFSVLAEILAKLKGKFILSLNDVPAVRSLFANFTFREVDTNYTIGGADKKKRVTELLISNF